MVSAAPRAKVTDDDATVPKSPLLVTLSSTVRDSPVVPSRVAVIWKSVPSSPLSGATAIPTTGRSSSRTRNVAVCGSPRR